MKSTIRDLANFSRIVIGYMIAFKVSPILCGLLLLTHLTYVVSAALAEKELIDELFLARKHAVDNLIKEN